MAIGPFQANVSSTLHSLQWTQIQQKHPSEGPQHIVFGNLLMTQYMFVCDLYI